MLKRRKKLMSILVLATYTSLVPTTIAFAEEIDTNQETLINVAQTTGSAVSINEENTNEEVANNEPVNSSVTSESDFEFDSETGTITHYIGEDTDVVIPNTINGVSVKSIGAYAFYGCSNLTSIIIPDGVTSIECAAFGGCSSLTSITIPNGVTSIECATFADCSSLTSITIPDSVTRIGHLSTEICMLKGAFYGCSSLTSITIPNDVTSIEGDAFAGCSSLKSITIPDNVTYIGEDAFFGCDNLTNISVNNNNENYISVDGVLFNKAKTEIIKYPAKKENTSYIIPDSVTIIDDYAFEACSGLTNITIPDSVTIIDDYAFEGCSSLTNTTIPDSVTRIGRSAFEGCDNLTNISVDNNNKNYIIIDGVLFNKGKTEIIKYPAKKENTSYIIPDSVTIIDDYAFEACSGLTNITIPDSVTRIGMYAFKKCGNLTRVTIPGKVVSTNYPGSGGFMTLPDIGYSAFGECINAKFYVGIEKLKQSLINSGVDASKIILNGQSTEVSVTSVTLDNTNLSLVKGDTSILTATIAPNEAINKSIVWTSDNLSVASIDENGVITGVGVGTATITATTVDGGKIARCNLTITATSSQVPETTVVKALSINLNKITDNLVVGGTDTLVATVNPSNATNKAVTWTSSNSNVATVDKAGKITAVGVGSATISCMAIDGDKKSATCNLTVTKATSSGGSGSRGGSGSSSISNSTSTDTTATVRGTTTTGNGTTGITVQPVSIANITKEEAKAIEAQVITNISTALGESAAVGEVKEVVAQDGNKLSITPIVKEGKVAGAVITAEASSSVATIPVDKEAGSVVAVYKYVPLLGKYIQVPDAVITADAITLSVQANATYVASPVVIPTTETITQGWVQAGTSWYMLNATGDSLTGWQQDGRGWTYMSPTTGVMQTGWTQLGGTWYYLNTNGYMATGWVNDESKWYYLNADGSMASNTKVNGYQLGANGEWIS